MTTTRRRVLLIGGSGQIGRALASTFAPSNDLLSTAYRHAGPEHESLDLGDTAATTTLLNDWRPHLVLLAGAMCHVDECERQPDLCRRINVAGPAAVAEYARRHGSRLVFFSTDHVFDGAALSYREADAVHPLSVYAKSKAEAEAQIRELAPEQHLIIRTGWVYGPDVRRRNFVLRLIDRLRQGETVDVPSDQWGSPTYTADVAGATHVLVEREATGTFHATGPEFVDRVTLARIVCDRFGLEMSHVAAKPTAALNQAAPRSLRVLLDCGKLRGAGVPAFRRIDAGLDDLASWSSSGS